ncbi:hypothetical protein AB4Y67_02845 [Arthrobacter sp. YAF17]
MKTISPFGRFTIVKQHGDTHFQAIDALVRTHPTELQQHPIAYLAHAA